MKPYLHYLQGQGMDTSSYSDLYANVRYDAQRKAIRALLVGGHIGVQVRHLLFGIGPKRYTSEETLNGNPIILS